MDDWSERRRFAGGFEWWVRRVGMGPTGIGKRKGMGVDLVWCSTSRLDGFPSSRAEFVWAAGLDDQ